MNDYTLRLGHTLVKGEDGQSSGGLERIRIVDGRDCSPTYEDDNELAGFMRCTRNVLLALMKQTTFLVSDATLYACHEAR